MDPASWNFTTATADTTKPTLTSRTPAAGATGVPTTTTVTAVFDEAVTAAKAELRTPAGTLVPATTAYAAATRTLTLTPTAALAASTTYTATVSEATDAAGNVMDPASWNFTTAAASTNNCPCTIWAASAVPERTDPDTSSVELGVRFRATQDGFITGIRYYKPSVVDRHPRRVPVDEHRNAAGHGDLHQRVRQRLATGPVHQPRAGHRQHHLRRLLLHPVAGMPSAPATSPPPRPPAAR